jgi:hypothetical protein
MKMLHLRKREDGTTAAACSTPAPQNGRAVKRAVLLEESRRRSRAVSKIEDVKHAFLPCDLSGRRRANLKTVPQPRKQFMLPLPPPLPAVP